MPAESRGSHGHAPNINVTIGSVFAVGRSRADSKWSRGRLELRLTSSRVHRRYGKFLQAKWRGGSFRRRVLRKFKTPWHSSRQRVVTDGPSPARKSKVHFRAGDCDVGAESERNSSHFQFRLIFSRCANWADWTAIVMNVDSLFNFAGDRFANVSQCATLFQA